MPEAAVFKYNRFYAWHAKPPVDSGCSVGFESGPLAKRGAAGSGVKRLFAGFVLCRYGFNYILA